mgnify:CR=1 FL=1
MKTKKGKIEVFFTEDYKLRIEKLADRKGVSMAEVLRRAMDNYLAKYDR